jgi:hypothetical protein
MPQNDLSAGRQVQQNGQYGHDERGYPVTWDDVAPDLHAVGREPGDESEYDHPSGLHDRNGHVDLAHEPGGGREQYRERFTMRTLSSAEFDSGDYSVTYLVDYVLAAREPMVIAAALKSMKTTLSVALAMSLALAEPFLGKFAVRRPMNVLLLSGESGLSTLQNIGRRIARSYGLELGQVDRLFWSKDLPRLGHESHLLALREALVRDRIEVLIFDPLYLALPGADANNLMVVGGYLRRLSGLCDELGVTLVVVHHIKRNTGREKGSLPELADISWAGTAEWARQWLLLERRSAYVPGTGEHKLWMTVGGSAGHSSYHALNIFEGTHGNRTWQVDVMNADEVRADAAAKKEQARQAKEQAHEVAQKETQLKNRKKLLAAAARFPAGETKAVLFDKAGLNSRTGGLALSEALEDGELMPCQVTKGNKATYDGYRLPGDNSDNSDNSDKPWHHK